MQYILECDTKSSQERPQIMITTFGESDPIYNPGEIQQAYGDTCAIKSQQLILKSFGVDVTEEELINEAMTLQIYSPGAGTPLAHMGDLLELHGVDATMFDSANKYTLMHELAQGHQVMVAVDSGELWTSGFWEKIKDFLFGGTPNHALIVSGIDVTNEENVEVVLTDPGTGNVMRYPYDQFADAWSDSSFTMLATNDSPVELKNGILDNIMGMDTQDWMNTFGDVLETGVEVATTVADYLAENPQIVLLLQETLPIFLANNANELAAAGVDLSNIEL